MTSRNGKVHVVKASRGQKLALIALLSVTLSPWSVTLSSAMEALARNPPVQHAEADDPHAVNAAKAKLIEALQNNAKPDAAAAKPAEKPVPLLTPPAAPAVEVAKPASADSARLTAKARGLIQNGDIAAARLILERAVAAGDSAASFARAETYEPRFLRDHNVLGVKPDEARAKLLYSAAAEGGVVAARERLAAMENK